MNRTGLYNELIFLRSLANKLGRVNLLEGDMKQQRLSGDEV